MTTSTWRKGAYVMVVTEHADGTQLVAAGTMGRVHKVYPNGEVSVHCDGAPYWALVPGDLLTEVTVSQYVIAVFKRTYSNLRGHGPRVLEYETKRDLIVARAEALVAAGFQVSGMWFGSSKIRCRRPEGYTKVQLLEKVVAAVGEDLSGITFGRWFMVWWEPKR